MAVLYCSKIRFTYIYKGKYYNIRFNLLNEKIKIFYNNSQYFSNYSILTEIL